MKFTARKNMIAIFAIVISIAEIFVVLFSQHRVLWTIALTASIPLAAAVMAAFITDPVQERK